MTVGRRGDSSRPVVIQAYWWSPLKMPRTLFRETRHNAKSWMRSSNYGGVPFRNFGDELSAQIIAHVTGRPVAWAPPSRAEVLGIGSILEHLTSSTADTIVWGSGLRAATKQWKAPDGLRFAAVRGKLTRDSIGLPGATPLGDPGLLVRRLGIAWDEKDGSRVIIPHYSSFGSKSSLNTLSELRSGGWKIIPPTMNAVNIAKTIAKADFVASESLHGKILADALGVPSQLVTFGSQETTDKYDDYMSIWGRRAAFRPANELVHRGEERQSRISAERECGAISQEIETVLDDLESGLINALGSN